MGFNLGVYDKDRAYVVGLVDYINKQKNVHIRAKAYTSWEHLNSSLIKEQIDVLLVDEKMDIDDVRVPMAYICDDKDMCKKECYIYKYQNLQCITKQIEEYVKGKIKKDYKACDVYAVFSPLGRSGKTRFAKGLTYHYGDGIYFGLEEYPPMGMEVYKQEFSYYLSQMNSRLVEDITNMEVDQRGCRYVQLVEYFKDAECIGKTQIEWLLNYLRDSLKFKIITFDIGGAVLSDLEILDLFDVIYVPVIEDAVSGLKLDRFLHLLREQGLEAVVGKMRYIRVPCEGELDIEHIIKEEMI